MKRITSSITVGSIVACGALALAACATTPPPDTASDAADRLAQTSRSSYHVAAAQFWLEEACLTSSVEVYVDESSYRSSAGGPQRTTHVGVWAFVADTCGESGWDTLHSMGGWREIPTKDFQMTGNLGRARLTTSIDLYDWMSGSSFPLDVDVAWTGVGDTWTTKDRHHEDVGDTKYRFRSGGSGRTAEASGTLTLAALGMPESLQGSGWMVAQTSSSTIIEVGGKRPRAPRIDYFDAYPSVIFPGGSATLYWWASGTDPVTLHIDGGVGDVTGANYVNVAPSETTTYTLTATNRWGSSSAEVTIHVTPPPEPDDHEPNDTFEEAAAVTLDFRADLTLLPGDVDWFTFTLDQETTIRIVVDSTYPWIYPLVALFDDTQQVVADELFWNDLEIVAGTYFVAVTGYPDYDYLGLHSETGSYSLAITVVPPPVPDEHEPNDTPAQATPIALPFASAGLTITPGDVDWFTFTLTASTVVTVDIDASVLGSPLDSYIGIFDEGLNLLVANDDHESLDSWLEEYLETGVYYLTVTAFPDFGFTGDHNRDGFYFVSVTTTP